MVSSCPTMCIDWWYVQPQNPMAHKRVLYFIEKLLDLVGFKGHPIFSGDMELLDDRNSYELLSELRMSHCPRVQSLLHADIEKDFDDIQDVDDIEFIRHIRRTCLLYIREMTRNKILTQQDALDMFEIIHSYVILFQMDQYGLQGLWHAILGKTIDFIHSGYFVFLPYLMEWCPYLVTHEHYPKCIIQDYQLDTDMTLACASRPNLTFLYQKHQSKFQVYYPLH